MREGSHDMHKAGMSQEGGAEEGGKNSSSVDC